MKNKKLFAILTLVAFMLTMMPVMAFGATSNQIKTWVEDGSAYVWDGESTIKDSNKVIFGVKVPATDLGDDQKLLVFTTVAGTNEVYKTFDKFLVDDEDVTEDGYAELVAGDTGNITFTLVSQAQARLELRAILVTGTDFEDITPVQALNKYQNEEADMVYAEIAWADNNIVTFASTEKHDNVVTVDSVKAYINNQYGDEVTKVTENEEDRYFADLTANNGLDFYKVAIHVVNPGLGDVKGAEVKVAVNKVGAEASEEVVTTNALGVAKFNVFATKAGIYKITLTSKDAEKVEFFVNFGSTIAGSVTPDEVTGNFATDYEIAIPLNVTDANGNAVMGTDAQALVVAARDFMFTVVPDRAIVDTESVYDGETGDITVGVDSATNKAALLFTPETEGTYTIKMYSPNTGAGVAYVTVKVKDYDETVKAVLSYGAASYNQGATVTNGIVTLIDANGTKIVCKTVDAVEDLDAKFSYTGVGIENFATETGGFTVIAADQLNAGKFLGRDIVVNVVVDDCFATATVKIADAPAYLEFTPATAAVGTEANVVVKSLDLNNNVAALGVLNYITSVDYVVTNKPGDAVVSVDEAALLNNTAKIASTGEGILKIASNKEGTVTINVIAETAGGQFLTGIATVDFGGKATPVQTSATLIIGSNVFVANGGVQTAPAAPAIIDGRTYLPIRAVGQAIGAQVDYVDGVITLTLGTQKATMVPGSNVMTVGTETVTMDAAPYLAGDGHTMVPVRYAAQAFGYELGTTTNADGSVATVTIFK